MRLIFLYGLPGVGKLTIARELAELTGFRVFHNHLTVDLVLSVFEFGSKPFVELREAVWLEVFKQAAAADLNGLIFTFVFERTVRAGFIEKTQSVIESAGGEVLFVELTCTTEELEKRIEHPSRQKFEVEFCRDVSRVASLRSFRVANATEESPGGGYDKSFCLSFRPSDRH